MKLLLDESVDRRLINYFPKNIEAKTTQGIGWAGINNGELLKRAATAGFNAIITVDKNIEYQQNLKKLPITIIILSTPRIKVEHLKPLIPKALSSLKNNKHNTLIKISPDKVEILNKTKIERNYSPPSR